MLYRVRCLDKDLRRWEDEQFGLLLNDSWSVRHTWKLLDIQASKLNALGDVRVREEWMWPISGLILAG